MNLSAHENLINLCFSISHLIRGFKFYGILLFWKSFLYFFFESGFMKSLISLVLARNILFAALMTNKNYEIGRIKKPQIKQRQFVTPP